MREIDEAMYVMFRSLVLTGVILVPGFGAAGKIIDYIGGTSMAEVRLNWVVAYMVVMVTVCSFMAVWHHRHWLKTDRKNAHRPAHTRSQSDADHFYGKLSLCLNTSIRHGGMVPDYQWAVVGVPSRKYLWVLSRTPTIDGAVYDGILRRVIEKGYDPTRLKLTAQPK